MFSNIFIWEPWRCFTAGVFGFLGWQRICLMLPDTD